MLLHLLRASLPGGYAIIGTVDMTDEPVTGFGAPVVEYLEATLHADEGVSREFTVTGKLQARLSYPCARCLTDVQERMELPFHEVFSRLPLSVAQEEADVIGVSGDEVDIAPYIRQALYLDLPMQVLCKQDCAGLCPYCGVNRNLQPCDCASRQLDPRFEALASLLTENDDETGGH